MSEFHYVRTMGVDGGVDACDGPAIGMDLESILKKGLPPEKVALEIIASMCEILDIADQDGEVHGDVHPKYVFLDDTGAVSIEGFGKSHKSSRAPEGDPIGTATDLYGLGYTAFRLLATAPLDVPKGDPDQHDDAVIDSIVGLGFGEIPEEFHGDIQWFLAKLMAFETDDRPPAVDAWRSFVAFAEETGGEKVEQWAAEAIEGRGARRDARSTAAAAPPPSSDPGEDLGGPTKAKGPLSKGAIDFTTGGGKPASATAFWSKDALKGALAASEPTDEEPSESEAPTAGGGGGGSPAFAGGGYKPQAAAATSFWSKDQLEAERGPKRGGGAPNRPPRAAPPGGPAGGAQARQPAPSQPAEEPDAFEAAPPQQPQGAAGRGLPPGQQIAQGQVQQQPGYPPGLVQPAPPPEEGGGGAGGLIAGGVVVVLFLVLCLGGGAIAAAVYYFNSSGSTTSVDVEEDEEEGEDEEDKPKRDTGEAAEEPEPAPEPSKTTTKVGPKPAPSSPKPAPSTSSPKPAPSPTSSPRPAPSTSPSPSPSPSPSVRPSTSTRPAPAPAPAPAPVPGGKATVTFSVGTRGTIGCSDGQSLAVDGTKTAEFEGYQLPVSCMITVDGGGRWAGLISTSGTIRCSGSGSAFNCSGP